MHWIGGSVAKAKNPVKGKFSEGDIVEHPVTEPPTGRGTQERPHVDGGSQRILSPQSGAQAQNQGQTRQSIAEELWRVILFSEFVFDAAGDIPASLETVPKVDQEAKALVYEVCDELRKHEDHKDTYKSNAEEIEQELSLADRSRGMTRIGERDTFPFEERLYLQRFVDHVFEGRFDKARDIGDSRKKSIWLDQEGRMAEWSLAFRALELLEAAGLLVHPSFQPWSLSFDGYAMTWRELDRNHRELEQAVNEWQGDHYDGLEMLVIRAGGIFPLGGGAPGRIRASVWAEGWPASGSQLLWNNQIFSKIVHRPSKPASASPTSW